MKIAIDEGHGVGQDRGAVGYIAEETVIAMVVADLIPKLISLGHEVLRVRPIACSSVGNSLAQRCANANNWGADIVISIHANAGGGTGAEVYTYNGEKLIEGQRFLQLLLQEGMPIHAYNKSDINSGIKDGSELAMVNGTKSKSLLYELMFVDTNWDVDFFNTHVTSFSNALVYSVTGVDLRGKANAPVQEKSFKIDLFAHIQDIGNTNVSGTNDVTIGTVGQSRRIEALAVNIDGVDIDYTVHAQDIGNITGVTEGQVEGTIGQSKRIEAITINVKSIPQGYKLQYQAHCQDIGWMDWKESGQLAGTTGKSLRMEALRIRIVKE